MAAFRFWNILTINKTDDATAVAFHAPLKTSIVGMKFPPFTQGCPGCNYTADRYSPYNGAAGVTLFLALVFMLLF